MAVPLTWSGPNGWHGGGHCEASLKYCLGVTGHRHGHRAVLPLGACKLSVPLRGTHEDGTRHPHIPWSAPMVTHPASLTITTS